MRCCGWPMLAQRPVPTWTNPSTAGKEEGDECEVDINNGPLGGINDESDGGAKLNLVNCIEDGIDIVDGKLFDFNDCRDKDVSAL